MRGDVVDAERLGRGEQRRFDGAGQLVHQAAFKLNRRERFVLRDFEPAEARELKRGEEARRQGRAAKLPVAVRFRQEAFQQGPFERHADHPPDPLDRLVERHHRARMDDVHGRLGARAHGAISREQVEVAHLPGALRTSRKPSGAARDEDVAANPVAAEQPRARLAHRVEPLQPQLQPKRDFFRARVCFRVLGQQQAGFKVSEPRRHDEIIGGDLQLQRARLRQIGKILFDQLENRNLREVDLLRPGQGEQEVERPFPAVEGEVELIRLPDRAFFEILFHACENINL